ncbi:glycosyltransferase family 2 protein [Desulfovibrio sp. OttesenSCG-928-I05]|nr:glycosyltransferase family 2 protein [Desulfovibrio sp. OttesenSCG-928-I05]
MHGATVHILTVTYNAKQWLPVCCHTRDALPENWRMVVVDNASTDGTTDAVEKDYPHVHLIRSRENLGFGRANNLGLREALESGADYVFLLNQDAEISIDGLAELIRLHAAHPECRIISPVQYNGEGSALDYSFARFCAVNGPEIPVVPGSPALSPTPVAGGAARDTAELLYADWGIAAGWLLPRATLQEIGGFNPLFFHYGEDEDYVNRVRFHGGKIAIAPAVAMRHHRTEKAKKKTLDSRFLDRLIEMADPGRPALSPLRVARYFANPVFRQLCKGNTALAAFLVRSCRELMRGDAPGSVRDTIRRKGATFL